MNIEPEPMETGYVATYNTNQTIEIDLDQAEVKTEYKLEAFDEIKTEIRREKINFIDFRNFRNSCINNMAPHNEIKTEFKQDVCDGIQTETEIETEFKQKVFDQICLEKMSFIDFRNFRNSCINIMAPRDTGKKHNLARFNIPDMLKISESASKEADVFATKPMKKGEMFGPYKENIISSEGDSHFSSYSWEKFESGSKEAGVFALKPMKKGEIFGPYKENIISSEGDSHCSSYSREIFKDGFCCDDESSKSSNWMNFVNSAKSSEDQNLEVIQINENTFYRVVKDIEVDEELLVFYGCDYMRETGLELKLEPVPELLQFEDPFACPICGRRYNSKHYLNLDTKNISRKYSCDSCVSKLASEYSLKQHSSIHTGEKPFACTICSYKCDRSSEMTKHMRTHTGKSARSYYSINHTRTHTGEKPFACMICTYKCAYSSSISRHMLKHTGEKPFACTLCTYKCATSNALTAHMRTHTGEKPFACSICTYKCAQSTSLTFHMRKHTGEKPFACTICAYKCTRSSNLTVHMRTHTCKKPFVCT